MQRSYTRCLAGHGSSFKTEKREEPRGGALKARKYDVNAPDDHETVLNRVVHVGSGRLGQSFGSAPSCNL
jgi:hypothetical protein